MRRSERECTDPDFINDVLQKAEVIYVAINTQEAPYVLPFNFVLYNGALYIHCAREGRKIDLLRADSRVGFTTAADVYVEKTTSRYRCVCGEGHVNFVEDAYTKNETLKALASKYKAPCKFPVSDAKFAATQILRINIDNISGKHSHPNEGPRPVPHYTE